MRSFSDIFVTPHHGLALSQRNTPTLNTHQHTYQHHLRIRRDECLAGHPTAPTDRFVQRQSPKISRYFGPIVSDPIRRRPHISQVLDTRTQFKLGTSVHLTVTAPTSVHLTAPTDRFDTANATTIPKYLDISGRSCPIRRRAHDVQNHESCAASWADKIYGQRVSSPPKSMNMTSVPDMSSTGSGPS